MHAAAEGEKDGISGVRGDECLGALSLPLMLPNIKGVVLKASFFLSG